MITKNLAWLRQGVGRKLNYSPDEADQDFAGTASDPYFGIDGAINEAYREAVNQAATDADPEAFIRTDTFTWGSAEVTKSLPDHLKGKAIYVIEDITFANPGQQLWITDRERAETGGLFKLTKDTFQWGTAGPGSDKTLRVHFLSEASEMKDPLDEPELVPARHRDLLVLGAAIIMREDRDDQAPDAWLSRYERLKLTWWAELSRGYPQNPNRPRIIDPQAVNNI